MLQRLGLIVIFLAALQSQAEGKKTECTKAELKRMDCRVYIGRFNVRITPKTLAWFDGTWRGVDGLPLAEEVQEWQSVSFEVMQGAPILQLWLWKKGVGEASVQSLHWVTTKLGRRRLVPLAEGIVQKRRPDLDSAGKFIADRQETHSLRLSKIKSHLAWTLADQHRELSLLQPEKEPDEKSANEHEEKKPEHQEGNKDHGV